MRKLIKIFTSVLFLQMLIAPGFSAPLSIGEPDHKWPKKVVTVCWLNNDPLPKEQFTQFQLGEIMNLDDGIFITATQEYKEIVKSQISQEFTAGATGISFTGWKDCRSVKDHDVVILVGEGVYEMGRASVGRSSNVALKADRLPADKLAFIYLNSMEHMKFELSSKEALKVTATHEFGHLAGLRHEHASAEACDLGMGNKEPLLNAHVFSAYDSESIMNYCYMFPLLSSGQKNGKKFGLSPKDIHGLKCMYVYDPKQVKSLCQGIKK